MNTVNSKLNIQNSKLERRISDATIAVIGLGYVGLPLAVTFGKTIKTIGFDLNQKKVARLRKQIDVTGEVTAAEFSAAQHLTVTTDPATITGCGFHCRGRTHTHRRRPPARPEPPDVGLTDRG